LQKLVAAAEAGDAQSQFVLGKRYATGDGVEQDARKAALYFAMAMRQGHAEAKNALIRLRAEWKADARKAVEAQPETATLSQLRTAADDGDAEAQYQLGLRYTVGDAEVKKNERVAMVYFELAARQGHRLAKRELTRLQNSRP
jgi:TPR repeat protein